MKAMLKRVELLATTHAKKFATAWDYYCCSTGAYIEAYSQGREDERNGVDENITTEIEITDGKHQLSVATFSEWKKQNESVTLKDAFKRLPFDFSDLRVEEKDGVFSFQGVAKRK